jgi:hypothetical protein
VDQSSDFIDTVNANAFIPEMEDSTLALSLSKNIYSFGFAIGESSVNMIHGNYVT